MSNEYKPLNDRKNIYNIVYLYLLNYSNYSDALEYLSAEKY